ncbi:disease resistance protein RGA2-like [Abrus precatorius]|uniref:Disease resistance protein RGA2-like n=1 Tax=Abrus precatorius TaxID=3816 RepID=A0A8B8MJJ7_ABRPR|nr:disease resistance protein RGA2-like [Abrus precatorius]
MAESVLFSVAESLIGKLASLAVKEATLAMGVYDDLQKMKDTISFINAVLLDAEQKQHQNNQLRVWLTQIKHVLSDTEDIIDDFECEALRKHVVKTHGSMSRKVRRFFSGSNPLIYRLKMAHEIKEINKRLDKIANDRNNHGLQTNDVDRRAVHTRETVDPRETYSFVDASDVNVMIGREQDKEKIIGLLLEDDDGGSLSVISIVGIGGLGKTTLAKTVFNHKRIGDSFDLKLWVYVSNDFELMNVLIKILNSNPNMNKENYKDLGMEQLTNKVINMLRGKKFLLVLDDVWNENHDKWVELKGLIQIGAKGSKVLVTTRSRSIAAMMNPKPSYSHPLDRLSEVDSVTLFINCAFEEGEQKKYPELLLIGEDIAKKCKGIPLAVRTLGSSLFSKVDTEEWKSVKESEIWNLPQNDGDILPALKLSYDQLPSYLKRCFACFSLLEKVFTMSSHPISSLWGALGFLPSSMQNKTFEDGGKQILHELHSRCFLQDFVDFSSTCTFKLHDLVHDLAVYVSKDEFQHVKSRSENISENTQHLSFAEDNLLGQASFPTGLRSIIFPRGANNEASLNSLLSSCKYLRYLELGYSEYKSLPSSIGKLKHLTFLGLGSNISRLPDSVCKLQNLQVLRLRDCENLETLPKGIENLISLRQLHLTSKQSSFPDKEIAKLTALETLSLISCDNLTSLLGGIQLPSLKSLIIKSCESLKSLPFHVIPNLESLFIISCHKLELSKEINDKIPSLKLKLLFLGDLPQLVTLPQWLRGSSNTLQSLGTMECVNLEELPEWFSTFVCLKTLLIESCPKLISLSDNMHHLTKLEYLEISDCPELYKRYQPNVGEDWHKISHIKRVIVPVPEEED